MPVTATKLPPEPTSPLAEAEAEREAAGAAVARLTAKIAELTRSGPGFDQILHARLKVELESAFQKLRRLELVNAEQVAAAGSPILPGVLKKIRLRRRRVEDLHSAVMGRMGESQRLREHLGGIKKQIAELRNSWVFREDQREARNAYLFPRDPEGRDHPAPARGGKKTPKSGLELAGLERSLETTAAELQIAVAAQVAASTRWESEKAVLDGWESAAGSLGASARAKLNAMPALGANTSRPLTNQVDFRDGVPGHLGPMIR